MMFAPLRRQSRGTCWLVLGSAALAAALLVPAYNGGAATAPAGQFNGWTTVFRDDFNGAAGSRLGSAWLYDIGTSYPGGAAQWGTGEVETSTDSTGNVHQDGSGHLVITPIRDAAGKWTSGRVETQRTDFTAPAGGQLALTASIRQPNPASGLGYWPAFWALGDAARPVGATNWPSIGELDVMEDVNASSQVSHTFHCGVWGQPPCNEPDGISSGLLPCAGCQTAYHTYSVVEDRRNPSAEQLRFYTDDVLQFTVNQNQTDAPTWANALHHGFFLILDVAIGGSYPDKVCRCTSAAANPTSGAGMSVDYVAAYTTGGGAPASSSPAPTSSSPPSSTPASSTSASSTSPPSSSPPSTTVSSSATPSSPASTASSSVPAGSVAATSPIQAERYTDQAGTGTEATSDTGGGQDVGWIGNSDWLRYDRVDFGTHPLTQLQARVASGAAAGISGLVEVHLDSRSSPAIGSFAVANTGSWQTWRTVPANIAATTGVHTVYLTFVSGATADYVNVNWFQFA